MKSKMKVLSILLAVSFTLSSLTACGTQEKSNQPSSTAAVKSDIPEYMNASGLPIVNKPINLKMVAGKFDQDVDWNGMLVWKEMEKRTGIHVEWTTLPASQMTDKKNILLASNELPDAFFRGNITESDLVTYGSQGTFLALNSLIDKHAPNFKQLMKNMPEIGKAITTPDGKIYGFPRLDQKTGVGQQIFLNQKWLDALNMKAPTTTDEFYQMLKAFKEKDPNGNGKQDEIPYIHRNIANAIGMFLGAWGLKNRGGSYNFDIDEKTNKLRYIPADPSYKELLQYLNKLTTEGLLDQDMFTNMKDAQITAKGEQGIVGGFTASIVVIGKKNEENYEPLPAALKGPKGHQMVVDSTNTVNGYGSFVITNVNKYPEATTRWVDYLYSDEGSRLYFLGVEGTTYKKNEKGEYRLMDEIVKNPKGLTVDQATALYIPRIGGGPTYFKEENMLDSANFSPKHRKMNANMLPYANKKSWPKVIYTKQENERLIELENDINTYVKEMDAQFISGKTPFSKWDEYVNTLKKMGLDEYQKIIQGVIDRTGVEKAQ